MKPDDEKYVKDLEKLIEKKDKMIERLEKKIMRKEEKILPLAEYFFVNDFAVSDLLRLFRLYTKEKVRPPKLEVSEKEYKETIACLGCIFGKNTIDDLHLSDVMVNVTVNDADASEYDIRF